MVETLEYLLVYIEGSVLSHGHCHVHNPIKRSLDCHVLVNILLLSDAEEHVAETAANWAAEKEVVSGSLNGVFANALEVKGMVAACKGESEGAWSQVGYFFEVADDHLGHPNQVPSFLFANGAVVSL